MQPEEATSKTHNSLTKWGVRLAALILWISTVLIGLLEILFVSRISIQIYAHFAGETDIAHLIGDITAVLAAMLYLGFVIGTGEYHRKHVGQTSSWTLFGWTIAIELLILILYFVV